MESSSEQVQNGGALPMVVWLRGEEEEFTLSAEDVMAALDIKRSRLTQISGRELRVGRRRVDRYLKPFYRPADVYSYQESTRAALTRQRSAAAVSSVADDIETRHKTILQETTAQLNAVVTNTSQTLQKKLSELLLATQSKTNLSVTEDNFLQTKKILRGFENLSRGWRMLLADFARQVATLHDSAVQQLRDILRTQHEQQQRTLETLQSNTKTQREENAASDAAHTAQLLALQHGGESIVQQLQSVAKQHEAELQGLRELVSEKTSELEQHIADVVAQEMTALRGAVTAECQAVAPRMRVWASVSP